MSLSLGNTTIGSLYLGSTKVGEAYLGNVKVYESSITAGTLNCTTITNHDRWTCSGLEPSWITEPLLSISNATRIVPDNYGGIGMKRDRIKLYSENLDLTGDLYFRPAFFQTTRDTGIVYYHTVFDWILTTTQALGYLPAGTSSGDMPKNFSASDVGLTTIHYKIPMYFNPNLPVYFGFLVSNTENPISSGNNQFFYGDGLLYNAGFENFNINWSLN